jgi:hypothetical protein
MECANASNGSVVWRRCSRAPFIGLGWRGEASEEAASRECGFNDLHFEVEKDREGSRSSAVSMGELKEVVRHFVPPTHE